MRPQRSFGFATTHTIPPNHPIHTCRQGDNLFTRGMAHRAKDRGPAHQCGSATAVSRRCPKTPLPRGEGLGEGHIPRSLPPPPHPILSPRGEGFQEKGSSQGPFFRPGFDALVPSACHRLPRWACSRSSDTNNALKLPTPNPREPCRSMISKNRVGRSCTGWVKICSR